MDKHNFTTTKMQEIFPHFGKDDWIDFGAIGKKIYLKDLQWFLYDDKEFATYNGWIINLERFNARRP